MPTYEYACRACGEHLEVVQSFNDDALTECPACGGPLRKVFGTVGIVLQGQRLLQDRQPGGQAAKAKDSGGTSGDQKGRGSTPSRGRAPTSDGLGSQSTGGTGPSTGDRPVDRATAAAG